MNVETANLDQLTALVDRDLPRTLEANTPLFNRGGLPRLPSLDLGALCEVVGSRLSTQTEEFFLNENSGAGQTRFHVVLRTPNMEDLDALAGGGGIYIPKLPVQTYPGTLAIDPAARRRTDAQSPTADRVKNDLSATVQNPSWHWALSRSVSAPVPELNNPYYAAHDQIEAFRKALPAGVEGIDLCGAVSRMASFPNDQKRVPIIPPYYSGESDTLFHLTFFSIRRGGARMQLTDQRGGPITVPFVAQVSGRLGEAD